MEMIRWSTLVLLILFTAYTVYCSQKEKFWRSLKTVIALHWGRQLTIDLYLGLFLFHFFIYLNEGSWLATLAWLLPALFLGNIVPMIYVVVHFHSILSHF